MTFGLTSFYESSISAIGFLILNGLISISISNKLNRGYTCVQTVGCVIVNIYRKRAEPSVRRNLTFCVENDIIHASRNNLRETRINNASATSIHELIIEELTNTLLVSITCIVPVTIRLDGVTHEPVSNFACYVEALLNGIVSSRSESLICLSQYSISVPISALGGMHHIACFEAVAELNPLLCITIAPHITTRERRSAFFLRLRE